MSGATIPLSDGKSGYRLAAIGKWDVYTEAETAMLRFTSTPTAPWTVVHSNDQRRARLECIRTVLLAIDYEGKDSGAIGAVDPNITSTTSNSPTEISKQPKGA